MKDSVKKQWVTALRSDKFIQTPKHLKTDDSYCCLGVLCELHSRETGKSGWSYNTTEETFEYLGVSYVLPAEVSEWAGFLDPNDPQNTVPGYSNPLINVDGKEMTLAVLNDDGYTFNQIAQLIETYL